MEQQRRAIKRITDVWRRTNHNPVKKKAEKVITPEAKEKQKRLSDILFDKLYKTEEDVFDDSN